MKHLQTTILNFSFILVFLFLPFSVFADDTFTTNDIPKINPDEEKELLGPDSDIKLFEGDKVNLLNSPTVDLPPLIVESNRDASYNPLVPEIESVASQLSGGNNFGDQPLNILLNQVMYVLIGLAVVLAVFSIIRGGYEYMASSDNASKKDSAKRRLQAAFGGLLLAVSATFILQTINPNITDFSIQFPELDKPEEGIPATEIYPITDRAPFAMVSVSGQYFAEGVKINNPDKISASVDGTVTLNGTSYGFRSGGGGKGYLPSGTYTVSNGRERSDKSSMMVGGYGYSFDLSDAYDSRVKGTRTLLRIHPDGGNTGTAGCVGIQGDRSTQEKFYRDLKDTLNRNGGTYKITIGGY
jgi:hypothetical protein